MKKLMSLILALVMVFSLAIPAMAAETTVNSSEGGSNTSSQDVTASYTPTITDVSASIQLAVVDADGTTVSGDLAVELYGSYLRTTSLTSYNVIATGNHTLTNWSSVPTGYMTPADVSLSITDEDGDGNGEVSTTSSHAKVELVDGVYVITVTLEKATEVSFQAMLSAVDADGAAVTGDLQTMFEGYQLDNGSSSSLTMNTGTYNLTFDVSDEDTLIPEGYKAPADITLSITSDGTVNGIVTSSNAKVELVEDVYVITVTLEEESTEPTSTTIYFDNSSNNWDEVNAYYWSDSNQYMISWPGVTMTLVEGETAIYSAEVPADAEYIIFSNNGSDQTFDQSIPTDGKNMFDGISQWTTYTPSGSGEDTTAKITGVSITVDGTTYTSGNVTITPNTQSIIITVTGTNLQNATSDHYVNYSLGCGDYINTMFTISGDGTTATLSVPASEYATSYNFEIVYCNNHSAQTVDREWELTGIYVTHTDAIPKIEKLSIKVGETTYDSGTVTLTPNSGDVTIIVSGSNLQNATENNAVYYRPAINDASWTISTEGTTATSTIGLGVYQNFTTATEIKFTNDNYATEISSGLYLIYQAETVSVNISWGAMSFTYSDEQVDGADKGWTCEDGANKITVTNGGTVAVNAAVSYTKAEGYDWLSGSFQNTAKEAVTNADVAVSGSVDFYLILSGDPTEAFSGTVGSVTVTITKVSTPEQITPEENTPDDGSTDTGSDTDSDAGVF